jgi:predicted dehydrogenase
MKRRAILVGLGYMGAQWARVLRASPDFETVAYVDLRQDRRDHVRQDLGIEAFPGFPSLDAVWPGVESDVAIIATPAFLHYDACLAALGHGLPLIVEKPLETEWAKAKEIVAEAARRGLLLLVDQNYRYTAPVRTMRRVLCEGGLGRPGFAAVTHYRNRKGAGTYQQGMPNPMLLDMSTHHFDTMRFLFSRRPVSVLARSFNPYWSDYAGDANVDALVEFAGDLQVTYCGSNAARGISIHPFANWRIECERGGLYLESHGYDLHLYRVAAGSPPKHREDIAFDPMPLENQACVLRHFRDCLETGASPEISGADHLETLAVAMAIIASSARGCRVAVDEFLANGGS